MNQAVMLKWTDEGVEGIQSLINEINDFQYTNLEVLDLSGSQRVSCYKETCTWVIRALFY